MLLLQINKNNHQKGLQIQKKNRISNKRRNKNKNKSRDKSRNS